MKTNLSAYYPVILSSHIFDGIPENSVSGALDYLHASAKRYSKDSAILQIGDKFHHAGIILDGTIEGSFLNESFDQISMNRFSAGESFGESFACAEIGISPMHIRAITDCLILFLDFTVLYQMKQKYEYQMQLTANLLRSFSKKNVFLNQKVRILSQKGLRDRILVYFRSLQTDNTGIVKVPFNQTALAEFLGVNRSALSRELGRMSDEKIININGKDVHLLK